MRFGERRAHDALADGLENFCGAELRDEQAEVVARGGLGLFDVGAGAGAADDEAIALQALDGLGDGDAGGGEAGAEGGLAGQAIAGAIGAGMDFAEQLLVDGAMERHLPGAVNFRAFCIWRPARVRRRFASLLVFWRQGHTGFRSRTEYDTVVDGSGNTTFVDAAAVGAGRRQAEPRG